jgi:hypothetical protein
MSKDDATFEELYALGVPMALLARRYDQTQQQIYDRAHHVGVLRPPRRQQVAVSRDLRLARIRANIAASPSRSMFCREDVAA